MKRYKFLLPICVAMLVFSCKEDELKEPDFDVSVEKTTFKKAENVTFNISGTPDNISFWSGEPGKIYTLKDSLAISGAVNRLHFTTQLTALASGNTGQIDNLRLFVSTDFSGKVDSANIRRANWTDITSRAKLPAATSTAATVSDTVDVTDLRTARDTMFVAFRYKSTPSSNTSRARKWTMAKFTFQNKFTIKDAGGKTIATPIFTHNTIDTDNRLSGFNTHSYKGSSVKDSLKWNNGSTAIFEAGVNDLSDEDWLVSRPFKLSARMPDKGVGIKKNTAKVNQYSYIFNKAGIYKVTFVANNASKAGVKERVKELTITITD